MLKLSKNDIAFIIKALIEHKEKIEARPPYTKQCEDLEPYDGLIQRLATYRDVNVRRRTRKLRSRMRQAL